MNWRMLLNKDIDLFHAEKAETQDKAMQTKEFQTAKFYSKTDFDMAEIHKEEAAYLPLPMFYTFKSRDERERILYRNFVQVGEDVKAMINEITRKDKAK